MDLFMFIFGMFCGSLFFSSFIINFVYFINLDLFNDFVLNEKNRIRFKEYYRNLKD